MDPREFIAQAAASTSTECILWPFSVHSGGYGTFNGKPLVAGERLVHRAVCTLRNGPAPFDNADAAHRCGVRLCCNGSHVRWRTRQQNHGEKRLHGTHLVGETTPAAKLTAAQACEIYKMCDVQSRIAEAFGVSQRLVSKIKNGHAWREETKDLVRGCSKYPQRPRKAPKTILDPIQFL